MRDLRGPLVADLNALLNRPPEAHLPWPKAVGEEKIAFSDEQAFAWMRQANPELMALDAEVERHRRSVSLARKDFFPDITVGLDYIDTAGSTGGRHPGDDGKDPVIAMVSINLPIWWGRLEAAVRQARHHYHAALHAKAQRANSLSAELKLTLFRFHDAERKVSLYRDTLLPKARQSFQATQAGYRVGKAGFIDVIDAQRTLLEFALAVERGLADRAIHLARLEMLAGRQIPRQVRRTSTTEPIKK